jgi:hypothetical protein
MVGVFTRMVPIRLTAIGANILPIWGALGATNFECDDCRATPLQSGGMQLFDRKLSDRYMEFLARWP